jgi:uncharacterized protein (TIGR02300 family)
MPDLGKKFTCYNCGTKFYNLAKPEAICPKCGANQKNAKANDVPPPTPRPPRRQVLMEPIPEENQAEFGEEGPAPEEDVADDDENEGEEEPELGEKEREDEEEF